ncbi:hypothetical protein HMPREF9248_1197 [Fannyhessea vaginae PB189-T1-4]|uniref:Uncharacterized protein n=1 Tax=Fannyhessea vaginae PB189-T1-4 TaxID=866774 RepID=A0ABN0B1B5_9ACTN|nr:hypothetical protein HMPREF9248_1197 [Fannyhessea vaginae PB189-T1-4]
MGIAYSIAVMHMRVHMQMPVHMQMRVQNTCAYNRTCATFALTRHLYNMVLYF